jgi:hypothetical protein
MAATSPRCVLVATVVVVLLASMAVGNGGIGMYDPCANVTVQCGDEFTFHVAFVVRDAFSSGGVQLSLCDSRLDLANRV